MGRNWDGATSLVPLSSLEIGKQRGNNALECTSCPEYYARAFLGTKNVPENN